MVGGVALGVAGTWVVGHAGVQALAVGADFSVLTFTIRTAPDWHTGNFRVAGEADGAVADGLVVPDKALGVGSTVAGVDTVPVVTGLCLWTVIVGLTTNHNNGLCTGDSWVPEITIWTCADGFVELHFTEGIGGTGVGDGARVEALSVDAGSVGRTLRVVRALGGKDWH